MRMQESHCILVSILPNLPIDHCDSTHTQPSHRVLRFLLVSLNCCLSLSCAGLAMACYKIVTATLSHVVSWKIPLITGTFLVYIKKIQVTDGKFLC